MREVEAHNRFLLDHSPDGIVVIDPATTQVLMFNETAHRQLGYSRNEFSQLCMTDLAATDTADETRASFAETLRDGQRDFATRYRTRHGEVRDVHVTAKLTELAGKPVCHCVCSDVTERKRAEEALQETRERMMFALKASRSGAWDLELEAGTTVRTLEHDQIFGYEEFLPQWTYEMFLEHVLPEDRADVDRRFQQAVREHGDWSFECRILRRDGQQRWIWACGQHRGNAEGHWHLAGVVRDITERKVAEIERVRLEAQLSQREKMDAIGQLAGGVAHDFNNQLAGVLGYAEMLVDRLEDPTLRRFAQNIGMAATRAADLTRQLLAFGRKGKTLSAPTDTHKLILEVVDLLKRSIDKRIEIRLRLDANPPTVLGDPTQLQNAILNLGLNARDAMPEGGELVFTTNVVDMDESSQGEDLPPGRYLQIGVTDSGVGMDEPTRRRLFEPFFTTKAVGKGTGLGLASVYGTVKNHGGAIRVHSEPARGSTFHLYLPLLEESTPAAALGNEAPSLRCGHARILVVDDEPLVLEAAADMLRDANHEVTTCADPCEALEIYRNEWRSLDLVILDLIMPRMSGKDLFLAMREVNPQIKAFLSSGYSITTAVQELTDDGVLGFLQKPLKQAELRQTVAEALRDKV